MRHGVTNSKVVLAILNGPVVNPERPNDPEEENALFNRDFCVLELRTAVEAGVRIQPVVSPSDKGNIGSIMALAPNDLQSLRDTEFVDLDRNDYEYLDVGMKKLERSLEQAGGRVPVVDAETSGSAAEPLGASSHLTPKSSPSRKHYAAFISHFKNETGTEARLVQMRLQDLLPAGSKEVFLDSDHLNDLRRILEHVKSSVNGVWWMWMMRKTLSSSSSSS